MSTLALIALVLMAAWVAGGLLLRVGGPLTVLVGLAAGPASPTGLLAVITGGIAWLAGHWLYAVRHQRYRSPLAHRYFEVLPSRLNPTRDQAHCSTATPLASSDLRALGNDHHQPQPPITRKDPSR
jgi:hypothetical protein